MIPTTVSEMAAMLYMMEVNEWGAENLNDKLAKNLAEASFDAAEVFFETKAKRLSDKTEAVKDRAVARKEAKKEAGILRPIHSPESAAEEAPKSGREPTWGSCEAS